MDKHTFVPPEPLGERFKEREASLEKSTPPWQHIILRFDGHSFSKFTKGFIKPFDDNLSSAIQSAMMDTINTYSAILGYCQSDEITIVIPALCSKEEYDTLTEKHPTHPFNGRIMKLTTLIASYISVRFNFHVIKNVNEHNKLYNENFINKINDSFAHFDGRALIFEYDETCEMLNYFVWRLNDSYRNCTSAYARSVISKKELSGKKINNMLELMDKTGFDYNTVDDSYKFGVFAKKQLYTLKAIDKKSGNEVMVNRGKIISKVIKVKATDEFEYLLKDKYWT